MSASKNGKTRSGDEGSRETSPKNRTPSSSLPSSTKLRDQHRERLAVVYVRQSTQQQVVEHPESLARQYAMADTATALGWSTDRVLVIDEDLGLSGRSAEGRSGFQRLLAEVTMDHVGLILGLEMSRLARSSKDWHHLLDLCAVFGTLLADQDGIYDPADPNDRLLLGLRGTISEVELHTMRNRLERGKLNKAERGELFLHVPFGYVKLPAGGIAFDPDEQVRSVVRLIFEKFDEVGSVHGVFRYLRKHNILVGIRPIDGPSRGELIWRPPSRPLLFSMIHHPMYAGAYAYGRNPVDPKRRMTHKVPRKWVTMDEWKVMLPNSLPAYITWGQFLANLNRLQQNQSRMESMGSPRSGAALLSGLLFCGRCGNRLHVAYGSGNRGHYACHRYIRQGINQTCEGLSAPGVDALIAREVLHVLEPAGLELCLQVADDVRRERERLTKNWGLQLERARTEVRQAERRYRSVDPENRLVTRTLEQEWETSLRKERQVAEDFDRFKRETPDRLTEAERGLIRALATEIPALWDAPATTPADRKEIIRCLIERVVVHVRGVSEHVDVEIHWFGGQISRHSMIRPMLRYDRMESYERMVKMVTEARDAGLTAIQIAERLNTQGFCPPSGRSSEFKKNTVNMLLRRLGKRRPLSHSHELQADEWWLPDLAAELQIRISQLRHWLARGIVKGRKEASSKYWILWADPKELHRLRKQWDDRNVGPSPETSCRD
jgi:DNA invertase Pin-like site-specific DNA recombinase